MRVAGTVGIVVLLGASVAIGQIKRTVLQQKDLSIAGREVVTARADFPAGGATGLHTHPGDEISYVAEGSVEIVIDGASTTYKAGEAFHVPAGKVHDAKAVGGPAVVIANYVIEKGKPATTPVK
ncbi:MAG TPA: cupin domain-containing protein [Vicinamibacterales bacterium]|jgi:quercetin dioxygenase-like cupin family protein|nr:cupin domain-containing protein [Vicinamibacterales bacterium]